MLSFKYNYNSKKSEYPLNLDSREKIGTLKYMIKSYVGGSSRNCCSRLEFFFVPHENYQHHQFKFTLRKPHETYRIVTSTSDSSSIDLFTFRSKETRQTQFINSFDFELRFSIDCTLPHFPTVNSVLTTALNDDYGKDFTIIVGKEKRRCHSLILGIRSSVFQKMLEANMKETSSSQVEIQDFSVESVDQMLEFIYTDKISDISKITEELFLLGDKYDLEKMKDIAGKKILGFTTLENVVPQIIFLWNNDFLSKLYYNQAKYFVVQNFDKIRKSNNFKRLIGREYGDYTELIIDLMNSLELKNTSTEFQIE